MTDTGQGSGEGVPENAGMVQQPGVSAPAAYTYPGVPSENGFLPENTTSESTVPESTVSEFAAPESTVREFAMAETVADEDDLLLMPGAQGAWVESAPAAEPGPHETSGRDSGSVDMSAVRTPPPAPAPPVTPRRPLHLGPPTPDATGSLVRSLADRGPAGAPVRPTAATTSGPENLDIPRDSPHTVHTLHAASPGGSRWGAPVNAETVVPGGGHERAPQASESVPVTEPVVPEPVVQEPETVQEAVVANESAAVAEPAAVPEYVPDYEFVAAPESDVSVESAESVPTSEHVPVHDAFVAPESVEIPETPAAVAYEDSQDVAAQVPEADYLYSADAFETTQPLRRVRIAEPEPEPEQYAEVDHVAHAEPEPEPEFTEPEPEPLVAERPHAEPLEPVEPEAIEPEPVQPEAVLAEAVLPEAVLPELAEPEAVQPDVAESEAVHPEAVQPDLVEADLGEAALAEPDLVEPEVVQPEPEMVQPDAQVPESDIEFVPLDGPDRAPQHLDAEPEPTPEFTAEEPEATPEPDFVHTSEYTPEPAATAEIPEHEATPESPQTLENLQTAENFQTPENLQTAEAAQATETLQVPEFPELPEVPEALEVPDTPQTPETPETLHVPEPAESRHAPAPPEPAAAEESTDSTDTMEEPVRVPAQREAEPPAPVAPPAFEAETSVPEAVTPVPEPAVEEPVVAQEADELDTRAAEQEESTAAVEETREPAGPAAPGYAEAEREAVLRVMRERRDIRNGFRSDPIPHDVLLRVLEAAHTAPSVGHSQPWDFVVIRSADTRRTMHELAERQREAYAKSLPKGRAKQFKELKIEAILETPVNIVVTADPTRGGRHTLGRHTQPQMAPYSSALAVENLWLAARAEGLGVGWVSFFDEREMVRTLGLPEHLEVVAYLCVGYVDEFPQDPELLQAGWSKRRPLSWVVHEETYGRRALPGEEPHDLLAETISNIRPLDAKALGEAWERQKRMTKPAGALGMLEIISAQLSGLSRQCPPPIPEPAAVAIFAGDHGVHAQGVTPWPQEVTGQMVANFLGGGAVCNAFANQVGAEVCVIDVGIASDIPATPGLLPRKVRAGTADMTTGPALTREEVKKAIEVGIETARDLVSSGNKALLTGEMGIANTTASAAMIAVFTDTDPAEVTGRGTGINDETLARKTEVVRRAIELHQPDPSDPIGVLAAIGGLEHAAMVGLLLGGASLRTPVILDGVSAGAAALAARAIAPEVLAACIAGHRSAEPGHVAALKKLGLRPLVDLDLRLGEGTGALLALPLVQSAARAMHEVATFDSAGVTEK